MAQTLNETQKKQAEKHLERMLGNLKKRLGYKKPDSLELVTNSYEAKKKKYLAMIEKQNAS